MGILGKLLSVKVSFYTLTNLMEAVGNSKVRIHIPNVR